MTKEDQGKNNKLSEKLLVNDQKGRQKF